MKYFIIVHNVFDCPKVACSCDGAHDFFCYSQVNNALSPLCTDVLSTNETHEKENFDDWYMIITVV